MNAVSRFSILSANSVSPRPASQNSHTPVVDTSQLETDSIGNINKIEHVAQQNSWLSWLNFLGPNPAEYENDTENKHDLEAFREAKLAIETSKDACHYAISKLHGSSSVSLAVHGTITESTPVNFNEKKQPIMPHQLLENAIPDPRPSKFSETQSDQAKKSTLSLIPVSPDLDSNLRVITLSTKIRLWGEAIIHKEIVPGTHIYKSTRPSVERKRKKVVKRALVISVHSFLPTKFVRSVISQSTGSASIMAENAVNAVHRWANDDGEHELQVQSIALDGIGTIGSRVDNSLHLLQNWADEVKNAEFIFMVSNSTASPVALQILQHMAKTSSFGLEHKKVGFLSMSGALQGRVSGLDMKVIRRAYTCYEYDIIMELFELQKSSSHLSRKLTESMNDLCQYNVKLALIGSVDDKFIPIASSVSYQTSHPNIYKGLYIDEDVEVPEFLIRLMSMILTMENVGYADHYQLLKDLLELSQGPLGVCATHGEIFKCPGVYDVGVKFALETTSLKLRKNAVFKQFKSYGANTERNLYHLPWNVRGLINDLLKTKHIKSMKLLKELVSEYRKWDPSTRPWREIKQCFAAFEESNPEDLMM
ncbi:hypothetical protein METBIDRAFT_47086 [Metschnikowia bicuspidata var. bicuspidata NRRL YB-4993]|uniref:YMC020W-like alpha/beta hydrolase domain-containing protein n=1 Tax=Metschnikowia bicuspidata var. bicuspidata NRRL YB-4993 TaxID=869754 RepID=A0A1A0H5U3_9ASCO|nr:hypothetical protein METBIDRAFT_47086 [Metschnikowia bicuspidata var. bicuspidata NRRL YB-4993]OBA19325.1 hypothetical protein METBIDRAFT_47086 [Metschnikowia bicuspidata var. bicuspidata NRRL YB-4993]